MSGLTFHDLGYRICTDGAAIWNDLVFTDNVVEYCTQGFDASSTGLAHVARNVFRHNGGGIGLYHNSGLIECNEWSRGSIKAMFG